MCNGTSMNRALNLIPTRDVRKTAVESHTGEEKQAIHQASGETLLVSFSLSIIGMRLRAQPALRYMNLYHGEPSNRIHPIGSRAKNKDADVSVAW